MRAYELMLLLNPELEEEAVEALIEKQQRSSKYETVKSKTLTSGVSANSPMRYRITPKASMW